MQNNNTVLTFVPNWRRVKYLTKTHQMAILCENTHSYRKTRPVQFFLIWSREPEFWQQLTIGCHTAVFWAHLGTFHDETGHFQNTTGHLRDATQGFPGCSRELFRDATGHSSGRNWALLRTQSGTFGTRSGTFRTRPGTFQDATGHYSGCSRALRGHNRALFKMQQGTFQDATVHFPELTPLAEISATASN